MKNQTTPYLLILLMLSQSCVVYQQTSVPLSQAVDKGKVKVISKSGEKKKFKNISLTDSLYYGHYKERLRNDDGISDGGISDYGYYGVRQRNDDATSEWVEITKPLYDYQLEAIYLERVMIAKNAIYTSLNGYMMTGGAVSINYDRRIGKSLWATTGIGKYPLLGDAFKVDLKLTTLIGKRSSHLELALGVLYGRTKPIKERYVPYHNVTIPYKPAASYIYPAFTIGYRYQDPKGGPVFRAGFGYYEANIGLGFSF